MLWSCEELLVAALNCWSASLRLQLSSSRAAPRPAWSREDSGSVHHIHMTFTALVGVPSVSASFKFFEVAEAALMEAFSSPGSLDQRFLWDLGETVTTWSGGEQTKALSRQKHEVLWHLADSDLNLSLCPPPPDSCTECKAVLLLISPVRGSLSLVPGLELLPLHLEAADACWKFSSGLFFTVLCCLCTFSSTVPSRWTFHSHPCENSRPFQRWPSVHSPSCRMLIIIIWTAVRSAVFLVAFCKPQPSKTLHLTMET